jgi:hypothetical protein
MHPSGPSNLVAAVGWDETDGYPGPAVVKVGNTQEALRASIRTAIEDDDCLRGIRERSRKACR